jgi:hypothetical protein
MAHVSTVLLSYLVGTQAQIIRQQSGLGDIEGLQPVIYFNVYFISVLV